MLGHSALGQHAIGQSGRGTGLPKLEAVFAPVFVASILGGPIVSGEMAATFAPAFVVDITGGPIVSGELAAAFAPMFVANFEGDSDGTKIIVPRDPGGIGYLVEIGAYDKVTAAEVTLRYGAPGFNTLPTDTPPNAHYAERVKVPGDYTRTMFSDGTTSGSLEVGTGVIELVNVDGGLDGLLDHGFDGRTLRIRTVSTVNPVYASSILVFQGTVEQVELTWAKATVRLRDRLAELDKPIQETLYAGTTVSGGMNEAEGGPDDIKGQPKPLAFGAPMNVTAVESNRFDNIYDLGASGLHSVAAVRDKGVLLTPTGNDYTTVAALRAANIAAGRYSTALNLGLIRLGSTPAGEITADPVEGGTGARTAAQIARRVLLRMGMVEGIDFLASDVAALDALNSAEIGYWIGAEERTALQVVGDVLGSIGASIVPDRLGVFRMVRLDAPAKPPRMTLRDSDLLDTASGGVERLATGDKGAGVPAWRDNLRYAPNFTVMSKSEIDQVNATAAFKAFAQQEWRTAPAKDETVRTAHPMAPELTVDTWLVNETDAQAEANRRLALHSVRRDRFRVPVKGYYAAQLDIGDVVALELPRFGLTPRKSFVVIGLTENFQTGNTTLDLWG